MFSVECSSGASGGSGRSTMLAGTTRRGEPCQPALSRTGRAMAPRLTDWLISARCWFRASMLTLGMTNAAPRPLVGVEHHLLRLAGMGADKLHAAVAETDVRDLHDRRHAVHHDDLEAPIELVSFARRKRQRHVGVRHLARVLPAPGPGIAANSVIAPSYPSARSSSKSRIKVRRSRAGLLVFAVSIRSSSAFQRANCGRGRVSRS